MYHSPFYMIASIRSPNFSFNTSKIIYYYLHDNIGIHSIQEFLTNKIGYFARISSYSNTKTVKFFSSP